MVEGKGIWRLYLSFVFLIMQGSSRRNLSFYLYITFTFSGIHLKTQTYPISDKAWDLDQFWFLLQVSEILINPCVYSRLLISWSILVFTPGFWDLDQSWCLLQVAEILINPGVYSRLLRSWTILVFTPGALVMINPCAVYSRWLKS